MRGAIDRTTTDHLIALFTYQPCAGWTGTSTACRCVPRAPPDQTLRRQNSDNWRGKQSSSMQCSGYVIKRHGVPSFLCRAWMCNAHTHAAPLLMRCAAAPGGGKLCRKANSNLLVSRPAVMTHSPVPARPGTPPGLDNSSATSAAAASHPPIINSRTRSRISHLLMIDVTRSTLRNL